MPKRRRSRGPHRELRPEQAHPLDPGPFMTAFARVMAAAAQPHPHLHERVSPHIIRRDAGEDLELRLMDTPLNRVLLTLRECYDDRLDYVSASWRVLALGAVLTDPRLAPWVHATGPEDWELHDAIIAAAATAPLNAQGDFRIAPFCAAAERWVAEHPDPPVPPPDQN